MRRLSIIFVLSILSCSSNLAKLDSNEADKLLHSVHDNQTSRQELVDRLGNPHGSFESGHIVTYLIEDSNGGLDVTTDYEKARYHLVLVFGPDQLLEKHSLVRVR